MGLKTISNTGDMVGNHAFTFGGIIRHLMLVKNSFAAQKETGRCVIVAV